MPRHESNVPIVGTRGSRRLGIEAVASPRAADLICAIEAIIAVVEGPDFPDQSPPASNGCEAAMAALSESPRAREADDRGGDFATYSARQEGGS